MPDFTRTYPIWELNETEAECDFSANANDVVTLETVRILGKEFSADTIREWLGTAEVDRLTRDGQEYWIEDGYRLWMENAE